MLVSATTQAECVNWKQAFIQYKVLINVLTNRHCVLATPIYAMDWTRDLIKKCEYWEFLTNNPMAFIKPSNSLEFNENDCELMDERWEMEKERVMQGYITSEEDPIESEDVNQLGDINHDISIGINSASQAADHVDNNNAERVHDVSMTLNNVSNTNDASNVDNNENAEEKKMDDNGLKTPEHENSSTIDNNKSVETGSREYNTGSEEGEIVANADVDNAHEFSVTPILKSNPVLDDEDDDLSAIDMKFFRQKKVGDKIDLSNYNVHIVKPAINAQNGKICAETPKFNHLWDYNNDTNKYNHPWCRYDAIMGTNNAVVTARVGQIVYFRSSLCGDRRQVRITEMQPTTDDSAGGIWKIEELSKNGVPTGKITEAHSFNFSKLKKPRMYTLKLCMAQSVIL